MEVRSSGGVPQACRHGGMGLWRPRCRPANIEVWKYGALEARCKCIDVETWRLWSAGDLEPGCRRADEEAWSSGGVLQV